MYRPVTSHLMTGVVFLKLWTPSPAPTPLVTGLLVVVGNTITRKEQLRHLAVSLGQHGFLVLKRYVQWLNY